MEAHRYKTHIHTYIHTYIHTRPQHINNQLPVRFGVIFDSRAVMEAHKAKAQTASTTSAQPEEVDIEKIDEGEQVFRLFVALYEKHGRDAAFSFLSNYGGKLKSEHDQSARADLRKDAFRQAAKENRALVKDENGKFTKVKHVCVCV